MTVKQISVFLENKPGQLRSFTEVLAKRGIDMRALSLDDTRDFGIARLIVDDWNKADQVLREEGYVFSTTPVLAVAIPDEPGGLNRVLAILGDNGVNVEYTYAFITRKLDEAYMIFRVEDNDKAVALLTEAKVELLDQGDLSQL